jgi:hypothetical protein
MRIGNRCRPRGPMRHSGVERASSASAKEALKTAAHSLDEREQQPGRVELRTLDAAGTDPPSLIATRADAAFVVTAAGDQVVYVINDGSARGGLYAAPLR